MALSFLSALFGGRSSVRLESLHFILYMRRGCHLCEPAWQRLCLEQRRYRFQLDVVDVDADPELAARFGHQVPVVTLNGKVRFRGGVNGVLLTRLLWAEANRRRGDTETR